MVYFNYQHCFLCEGESNQGQFVSPNALRSALPHSYNINIIKTNSDTTCGAIIGMYCEVALGHVLVGKQHTHTLYIIIIVKKWMLGRVGAWRKKRANNLHRL